MDIIKQYEGKNRLLLIFAASPDSEVYRWQLEAIDANKSGFEERDLLTFKIFEDEGMAGELKLNAGACNELRKEYDVDSNAFCVILIGKDGKERLRDIRPLAMDALFPIIDVMPLRKKELGE